MDFRELINWRSIELNGANLIKSSPYSNNKINSSRYSLLNFIPKNLLKQLQKPAYCFFLLLTVIQLFSDENHPIDTWTRALLFGCLLVLTFARDIHNNYNLFLEDKKTNNKKCQIWNGEEFLTAKAKNLLVGHIVCIEEKNEAPADLVILAIDGNSTNCFLKQSEIGSENSLVSKKSNEATEHLIENYGIARLEGTVKVEPPNPNFNSFRGTIKLVENYKNINLSIENFMIKGSVLRGSKFLFGIVVYTGNETRCQMNIKLKNKPFSSIEKILNKWTLFLLLILFLLVVFSLLTSQFLSKMDPEASFLQRTISYIILYKQIIPIELYVSLIILKCFEAFHIRRVMNERVNFNICDNIENLGRVEYILTGKKSLLSSSDLKLSMCLLNKQMYMDIEEEFPNTDSFNLEFTEEPKISRYFSIEEQELGNPIEIVNWEHLEHDLKYSISNEILIHFVRALCVCNSIIMRENEILAISDIEFALVKAAERLGWRLTEKEKDYCQLERGYEQESYCIVQNYEWNKTTKKSGVVVKNLDTKEYFLYVKGAIDSMRVVLDTQTEDTGSKYIDMYESAIKSYGLRTIVLAYKELNDSEIFEFKKNIKVAKNSHVNIENRIIEAFTELEHDLTFISVVGIQESISASTIHAIDELSEARLKIWIASSDSEHNLKAVASSSRIFPPGIESVSLRNISIPFQCLSSMINILQKFVFKSENPHTRDLSSYLRQKERKMSMGRIVKRNKKGVRSAEGRENIEVVYELNPLHAEIALTNHPLFKKESEKTIDVGKLLEQVKSPLSDKFSLIVDRVTFVTALADPDCRKLFVCLLQLAESVCFCGLLPVNKASIVKLIRENFEKNGLILGLGQNEEDVPMIIEADIAINTKSESENDLAKYSEVSLQSFSDLVDLVLLHGYSSYIRTSQMVILFLYKNLIIVCLEFEYMFISDYSGTVLMDEVFLYKYNTLLTGIPFIYIGVFYMKGYDIEESKKGWKGEAMWKNKLLKHVLASILHSVVIFVFSCLGVSQTNSSGEVISMAETVLIAQFVLVFSVLSHIALTMRIINLGFGLSIFLSVVFTFMAVIVLDLEVTRSYDNIGVFTHLVNSPLLVVNIVVSSALCVVVSVCVLSVCTWRKIKGAYKKVPVIAHSLTEPLRELYKESSSWNFLPPKKQFEINPKTLVFYSPIAEKRYKQVILNKNEKLYKVVSVILFVVIYSVVIPFYLLSDNDGISLTLPLFLLLFIEFLCATIIVFTEFFKENFEKMILFEILLLIVIKFYFDLQFERFSFLIPPWISTISYLILNVDFVYITILNLVNFLLNLLISIIYFKKEIDKDYDMILISKINFIIFCIILITGLTGYFLEKNRRNHYRLLIRSQEEMEKHEVALKFLLPPFVSKRVKQGIRYIAEEKSEVTVIFCDLVDFDKICYEYSDSELLAFLDDLFVKFDLLCDTIGVTKIETVGKTYMAAAGIKDSEEEISSALLAVPHARRSIEMAFSMLNIASEIFLKNGNSLSLKIGINTGPVTAGVVGFHKPEFSLVGDTVNTASRMCSTITDPNTIQISSMTFEQVCNCKEFYFREKLVDAKGKGRIVAYEIEWNDLLINEVSTDSVWNGIGEGKYPASPLVKSPFILNQVNGSEVRRVSKGHFESSSESVTLVSSNF